MKIIHNILNWVFNRKYIKVQSGEGIIVLEDITHNVSWAENSVFVKNGKIICIDIRGTIFTKYPEISDRRNYIIISN